MNNKEVEILLVEDNASDEELAIIALKKRNITNKIQVARDGVEALEYLFGSVDSETLKCVGPLVVLLDLKLPKINGLEVLRRIKSHPEAKKNTCCSIDIIQRRERHSRILSSRCKQLYS